MAPKRLKQVTGFWSDDLQNGHFSKEGLLRDKIAIQDAVICQADTDNYRCSSNSSKDADYLGR